MADGVVENDDHFRRGSKTQPITSYGLILFHAGKDAIRYLVYQRRDNYEYIDILRGTWNSEKRLRELFAALSLEEKKRLREYTFRELWDDLWVCHGSHIHVDGYERSFEKYEMMKALIPEMIDGHEGEIGIDPPWGFPKGKRLERETDVECALREFREETRLNVEPEAVCRDESGAPRRYSEFYKGNNNKPYATHYFLAEASGTSPEPITKIQTPQCIRGEAVSEEAADARWITYEEGRELLDPRRQVLLEKANSAASALVSLRKRGRRAGP